MRFEAPLGPSLTRELFEFWASTMEGPLDLPPEVFLGSEVEQSINVVYAERREGRLAGTCGLNLSRAAPYLGEWVRWRPIRR